MNEFSEQQEQKIKAIVRNYRAMDKLRDEEKQSVESFMEVMAEGIDKNFEAFRKSPKAVIRGLVAKWMKNNKTYFDRSAKLGKQYAEDIL